MKILQLISSSGFYGAENVVLLLSAELAELGHDVTVGVFNDSRGPNLELAQRARTRGLAVRSFVCRGRWDRSTVKEVSKYIHSDDIDVVHSHGYKANAYARLARIGTRARLISTCHNWIESSLKMRLYNALDRWCLRGFDRVIAVSQPVMSKLKHSGLARVKMSLISNGVDIAVFDRAVDRDAVRQQLGFDRADRIIGTIGRLSAEKGHGNLLSACARVVAGEPRCRVLVVGDGPLKAELENQAAAQGLGGRVVFSGKRGDVAALLRAMDVFVLPSLTEGQPMALLEAMAAGCLVVATAVGDVPEMLEQGNAGILVPPGDIEALAQGLIRCVQDRAIGQRLAVNARKRVTEKYSAAGMASAYLEEYRMAAGAAEPSEGELPPRGGIRRNRTDDSLAFDGTKERVQ